MYKFESKPPKVVPFCTAKKLLNYMIFVLPPLGVIFVLFFSLYLNSNSTEGCLID